MGCDNIRRACNQIPGCLTDTLIEADFANQLLFGVWIMQDVSQQIFDLKCTAHLFEDAFQLAILFQRHREVQNITVQCSFGICRGHVLYLGTGAVKDYRFQRSGFGGYLNFQCFRHGPVFEIPQRYKLCQRDNEGFNFSFYFCVTRKRVRRSLFILTFFGVLGMFPRNAVAQKPDSTRMGIGYVIGDDTVIHRDIKEVWVYPRREFKSPRFERQYTRLIRRVKKVYPYAKKASELLSIYEPEYERLQTDRQKRKLINKVEDQLMAQYKEEFKKMTISDGKVLIKLIDRQTGRTGYDIIKEFKGGFTAAFWQGIARLFRNNLKDEFDPYGEDLLIEEIVTLVELGYL